jgi:hypothetical protein
MPKTIPTMAMVTPTLIKRPPEPCFVANRMASPMAMRSTPSMRVTAPATARDIRIRTRQAETESERTA